MPETAPLDFTEDDITWVTSNLSVTADTLGVEAIDIRNWLVCFGCVLKDLRVFVARMSVWMDKSSPFWTTYHTLIACRLVVMGKRRGCAPWESGRHFARPWIKSS